VVLEVTNADFELRHGYSIARKIFNYQQRPQFFRTRIKAYMPLFK
jgi:hypothetical protein